MSRVLSTIPRLIGRTLLVVVGVVLVLDSAAGDPGKLHPGKDLDRHVATDHPRSLQALTAQARGGDPEAQFDLGMRYFFGTGGAKKDDKEAARWIQLAATQGWAPAQHNLGLMYQDGRGVKRDDEKGARWLLAAAEQGDASAQNYLFTVYTQGKGVPTDYAEAIRWLRLAAEQGNAIAQDNLGVAYMQGRYVPKDAVLAFDWFRRAALQGDASAQEHLGALYIQGQGVPAPDLMRAHLWLSLAAPGLADEKRRTRAMTAIEELEESFSSEELAAARARISACRDSGFKDCGGVVCPTGCATHEIIDGKAPGVTLPRVISAVKPQYTPEAYRAKVEGTVIMATIIGIDGTPSEIEIVKSPVTEYGLDKEAVAALTQWRFEPGRKNGKPVPVRITVEIEFSLR